jgi:hypothetical protein
MRAARGTSPSPSVRLNFVKITQHDLKYLRKTRRVIDPSAQLSVSSP